MKDTRSIGYILGIILGLTTLAGASSADQLPWPPGSPPQSPRPLSELSAEWWQWVYSIPQPYATDTAISNPLFDPTGASCMVGQQGSVWFLAGTNGATGPVIYHAFVLRSRGRVDFLSGQKLLEHQYPWLSINTGTSDRTTIAGGFAARD